MPFEEKEEEEEEEEEGEHIYLGRSHKSLESLSTVK